MFDALYTEFIKLKRSKIVILVLLTALFPCLVILAVSLVRNMYPLVSWNEIFFGTGEYLNLITPAMFCLFSGLIFSKEYKDNMMNILLTYPKSKLKFLFSKYVIMIPVVFSTFLFSFIFKLWLGLLLTDELIPKQIMMLDIKINLAMTLINLAFIPMAVLVCLIGKNEIVPSVYGASVLVLELCTQTIYTPWLIPFGIAEKMGYSASGLGFNMRGNINIAVIILLLSFIIPFIGNILYFIRYEK